MNTPDTEWPKQTRNIAIQIVAKIDQAKCTNCSSSFLETIEEEIVKAISSRDTYWKEMLSGVCLTHGCFCQHSCKHPCTCTKAVEEAPKFTNKDNLK